MAHAGRRIWPDRQVHIRRGDIKMNPFADLIRNLGPVRVAALGGVSEVVEI